MRSIRIARTVTAASSSYADHASLQLELRLCIALCRIVLPRTASPPPAAPNVNACNRVPSTHASTRCATRAPPSFPTSSRNAPTRDGNRGTETVGLADRPHVVWWGGTSTEFLDVMDAMLEQDGRRRDARHRGRDRRRRIRIAALGARRVRLGQIQAAVQRAAVTTAAAWVVRFVEVGQKSFALCGGATWDPRR
jgi:hypothetical protein